MSRNPDHTPVWFVCCLLLAVGTAVAILNVALALA